MDRTEIPMTSYDVFQRKGCLLRLRLWGLNLSKPYSLWREYAFLSLTRKIFKLGYYQYYYTESNQRPTNSLRGRSKHVDKNPRWRIVAILKNQKYPYVRNRVTDRPKIWYNDAHCPSKPYRAGKISNCYKSKMADGRHFKNR